MTYQRDPERPIDPVADDIIRRENIARRDAELGLRNAEEAGSYGVMPIVLVLLVLIGLGYLAYSTLMPHTVSNAPRTTEYTAPRTATPAPVPTVPPVAPETK